MRKLLIVVGIAALILGGWFGAWHMLMAADVARVKASMAHQQQRWQASHRGVTVSAEKVAASGFPFAFRVKVTDLTVRTEWLGEINEITVPVAMVEKTDAGQGRYRVMLPATVKARYAKDAVQEHYRVTMNTVPQLALSAADATALCGPVVGQRCVDVATDAPMISFAVGLPNSITLHMELGDAARDATFQVPPITVPIFQPIPTDISRPLELFVGVLREALVFKTPS